LQVQPTVPGYHKRFVTFVGKPERGYPENLRDSNLLAENEIKTHNYYEQTGGPTRILYLTELQPVITPVGFIVSNGEKIGEWMHWLPFVRFSNQPGDQGEKALRVFEISQDKTLMRDGYLLAPSSVYSIFQEIASVHHQVTIDIDRLQKLPNPSKYRATLLITPSTNRWAVQRVEQHGYREIAFFDN